MPAKKTRARRRVSKLFEPVPREAPPKVWPSGKIPGGKLPLGAIPRVKDADAEQRKLTMAEWQARRKDRPVLHIDFDAAAAIRRERAQRTQQWDSYMESRRENTS